MRLLFLLLRNLLVNAVIAVRRGLRVLFRARHHLHYVRIELRGVLPARRPRQPPFFLRAFAPKPALISEEELGEQLARVARDHELRGVLLVLGELRMGFGQLVAVRRQLCALREAGKEVVVYFTHGGNGTYLLASAGTRVLMLGAGGLDLTGLAAEQRFYKGLLDKIPADAQVIAVGRYKSAFDPFARTEMTPAHREAIDALLDDLGGELCRAIAERPGFDAGAAARVLDDGPYTAVRALEAKLVDGLCYADELAEKLAREGDPPERGKKPKSGMSPVPSARLGTYAELRARSTPAWSWRPLWRTRCIAYIPVVGTITSGTSRRTPLGGASAGEETVCAALEAARKDRRVRAVLLHVDSRGGSALASDLMWRAVRRLREEKPVVAYLGDYAASGGYYVGCAADHVIASPGTVTGSIGVISAKVSLRRLWERLGVNVQVQKRGERADVYSPNRPFTDDEVAALRRDIEACYEDFVGKVALSRKLTREEVLDSAEGRVWTGLRALPRKLVDALGSLGDALAETKVRAGFEADAQVPVVTAVGPSRGLGAFGFGSQLRALLGAAGEHGDLGGQAAIMGTLQAVAQVLPALAQDLGPFAALERRELEAPLALLPYEVTIR